MTNPYYEFMQANPPVVIGRDQLIKEILSGVVDSNRFSYQIVSLRNFGASTLLRYLVHPKGARSQEPFRSLIAERLKPGKQLKIIYLDFLKMPGKSLPQETYKLSSWIHEQLSKDDEIPIEDSDQADLKIFHLTRALSQASEKFEIVLLFDHFDNALQKLDKKEATQLHPLLAYSSIITATELPLVKLNEDSASSLFGSNFYPVSLDPLNTQDALTLLREPIKDYPGLDLKFRTILQWVGAQPYYLLKGAAECFDLQQRFNNLSWEDRKEFARIKLMENFRVEFIRYWNHLLHGEPEALIWLTTRQDQKKELSRHRNALLDLITKGLVIQNTQYLPFSELWRDFIREKAQEEETRHNSPAVHAYLNEIFSPQELRLFQYLQTNKNNVCTYEDLAQILWSSRDRPKAYLQTLRQMILNIREKISGNEQVRGKIINRRKTGYEYRLH